jgi:glycosyltransferase involved in cell wall biosynthesis
MTDKAAISIVIPVRDSSETLSLTLNSIERQLLSPVEVIVVDDGSAEPVKNLADNPLVRIIRLPVSLGPATARNTGADIACGDIILFVDADVVLTSNVTQRVSQTLQKQLDISAVQGIYTQAVPDECNVFTRYQNHYYHFVFDGINTPFPAICATYCFAIRKSVFVKMGGFDSHIVKPTVEDEAFGYALAHAGYKIFLDKQCQVMHLARYTLTHLVSRKVRMSFYQARNFISGTKPPLPSGSNHNKTHHPIDILIALLVSPGLLLTPFFTPSFLTVFLLIYTASNARFWRYLVKTEAPVFSLEMIFITWIDQISIFSGLTAGTISHFLHFGQPSH